MKKTSILSVALLVVASAFLSCTASVDLNDPPEPPGPGAGIKWANDNGGTLEVFNGTSKDIILFAGKNIPESRILGGVRAGTTKDFDVSFFTDFDVGGYVIVRGISLEEYESNKFNLSAAQIDYTEMVTYRSGTKYRHIIDPRNIGDYGFMVNNNSPVGIELRKDSPNGEKIAYLPGLAQNQIVYTSTPDFITLFPVYVYFSPQTKEITTLKTTTLSQSRSVIPEPLMNAKGALALNFPADRNQWMTIANDLKSPYAYITVYNGTTDAVRFKSSTNAVLYSQSGYQGINSGRRLDYEIEATDNGQQLTFIIGFQGIDIPVKDESGQNLNIRNSYNYQITVTQTGPGGSAADFEALIEEVAKRDLLAELLEAQDNPQE